MSSPAPSIPSPPVALSGQTSVIYKDALYTYQADAFQTLPLRSQARWSQLPMGVAVKGARPVVASSDGQDALFMVGGVANASSQAFPGLQRYDFGTGQWRALSPQVSVVQNRQMHGAAYLASTNSILVYSGFQDNSYTRSAQTYTISAREPYAMKSFVAETPPVMNPLLMSYNASHALMVGGDAGNRQIWTFSEADGWRLSPVALKAGLPDAAKVQGAVVQGSDGSRILQLFDVGQSPNLITSLVLEGGRGAGASRRDADAAAASSAERRPVGRRDDGLPVYNATFAPKVTRNGFSLASANGMVVLAGGNDGSSTDVLSIFNQTGNSWLDAHSFFAVAKDLSASQSSTTASATSASTSTSTSASTSAPTSAPTSTTGATTSTIATVSGTSTGFTVSATPTPSVSSAAAASASHSVTASASASSSSSPLPLPLPSSDSALGNDKVRIILGSVLGVFFGLGAILIIMLLLLRRLKQKKRQAQNASPTPSEKDAHLATMSRSPIPNTNAPPPRDGATGLAASRSVRGKISRPELIPHPGASAQDLEAPRAVEGGWGRYLANNNTVENLYPASAAAAPAAAPAAAAVAPVTRSSPLARDPVRNTAYTDTSEYTNTSPRASSYYPYGSTEIPPLSFRISHDGDDVAGHRHGSVSSDNDLLSHPSAGQPTWDPTGGDDVDRTSAAFDVRPPSSVYAESTMHNPGSPGMLAHFPGVPAPFARAGGNRDSEMSTNTLFPGGPVPAPFARSANRGSEASTLTVFPGDSRGMRSVMSNGFGTDGGGEGRDHRRSSGAIPGASGAFAQGGARGPPAAGGRSNANGDMSWLNLNGNK